jgi:hypothetical protein
MLTPADHNRYRNAIEDARHDLRGYRIKRNLLILACAFSGLWFFTDITVGVLSATTDTFGHVDIGGLVAGLAFAAVVMAMISGACLGAYLESTKYRSRPRDLRAARQRYEEAQKAAVTATNARTLQAELSDQEEIRDNAHDPVYRDIARMEVARLRKEIRDLEEN